MLEPVGRRESVGVQQSDELRVAHRQGVVVGHRKSQVIVHLKNRNISNFLHKVQRSIRAPVIHEKNEVGPNLLGIETPQAFCEQFPAVPVDDDDRNRRHSHRIH